MQMPHRTTVLGSKVKTVLLTGLLAIIATSLGVTAAWADVSGFIENDTHYRDDRELSKARNTFQFEYSKDLGAKGIFSEMRFNTTLRATYDAAYDLNDDEWGDKAGGPVMIQNIGGNGPLAPATEVPFGYGAPLPGTFYTPFGGAGLNPNNPNEGLEVLGQNLHSPGGGLTFGVPVRPCDKDSRGCIDDYMDADSDDLRFPEFNDRQDWLREFYISGAIPMGDNELGLKLGRQQIIWGRTDLFRVLDVINPVDFSRNNIYDELEDIRIPMWMLQAEYRTGANNIFDDLNYSAVWNFDKFRPNTLGQGGTPNQILDAGSFFRGMKNLWDNGGTVGNFAGLDTAVEFPEHVIGIREADMPEWSLANTQFGGKVEGVYKDLGFSLNYYNYRSQLPTLRGGIPAMNPFGPLTVDNANLPPELQNDTGARPRPFLPAFDIAFARVQLFGGSLDYYADTIKSVIRLEAAYTTGEEFINTADPKLYSDSDVVRWVLGVDRNTFIPFLNKKKAFLISGQLFGQHLLDHELYDGPLGKVGIPDWEDNYIATLLVKGWWMQDRLSPQFLLAHDFEAEATALEPSISWLITDKLSISAKCNFKVGTGARQFDDLRADNQFPPFTSAPFHDNPLAAQATGSYGYEPSSRFRSGPIGMAHNEDEVAISIRYAF